MVLRLPRVTGWGTDPVVSALDYNRERDRKKTSFMVQAILNQARQGTVSEEAYGMLQQKGFGDIISGVRKQNEQAKRKGSLEMETMKVTKALTAQKLLTLVQKEFFSLLDRLGPNDPSVKAKAEKVNETARILKIDFSLNPALTNAQNKQKMADAQAKTLFAQIRDIKVGGEPEETRLQMIGLRKSFDEFKENNKTHENVSTIEAAIKRQQQLIDAATERKQVVADKKAEKIPEQKKYELGLKDPEFKKYQIEMKKAGRPQINIGQRVSERKSAEDKAFLRSPKFRGDVTKSVRVTNKANWPFTNRKERSDMVREEANLRVITVYPNAKYGTDKGKKGWYIQTAKGWKLVVPWAE